MRDRPPPVPKGRARFYRINDRNKRSRVGPWKPNQVLYEWATIVAQSLLNGGIQYRIGGMYIEFANVASPGDVVPVPSFTRADGSDYYNALAGSPDIDYLRVPLTAGVLNTTDMTLFPKGNLPTFIARTQGAVGVHGKPFSDVHNSTVFGAALVAFPDFSDQTQDLIFSRFYVATNQQLIKTPTSQIGIDWEIPLQ